MVQLSNRNYSGTRTASFIEGAQEGQKRTPLPAQDVRSAESEVSPVIIPVSAWESIPPSCRIRVLEFQRLRDEYTRSFDGPPSADELDRSQKLTLEQIVELSLLNSREYQSQKERLYRTALRLTLERFQFDLKPSAAPGTNRVELDYRHTRSDANGTVNTLSIPSNVQVDKVLRTGGDLLARLANDIVLTFNGPQGFATDLNSELFVSITQTVFQRDIRFESLTQAERDVVYAARDFARFRKQLFNQLAEQYYELVRIYRQVEIDALNYFTLVRAQSQRGEEFRVGLASRVQVDQIEQNTLSGLIAMIGTCNRLERDLDSLKLRIGLPTETWINLNLAELENLTLADEFAVAGQLVVRVRNRLERLANLDDPDRGDLLNLAIELIVRMQESFKLGKRLGHEAIDPGNLRTRQSRLQLDQARFEVEQQRKLLAADSVDPAATKIRLVRRNLELIDSIVRLLYQHQELGVRTGLSESVRQGMDATREGLLDRAVELRRQFGTAIDQLQLQQFEAVRRAVEQLRTDADQAVLAADRALGIAGDDPAGDRELKRTVEQVLQLLDQSDQMLRQFGGGLVPVEISVDDAMVTALVLRFELMNQRGFLADNWRHVKLAADDLKSILNLSASQRLDDFRIKDSESRLQLRFDAPLNRLAQRNAFREALIDYQAGRRRLMELEDQIKVAARSDLRDLALSKQQYELGVASAALAFERVAGTRLQLRLGVAGVQARDFLEAQTAYAASLSAVAARHIGYILSRTQLFLDLELLEVDEGGFWQDLRNDQAQPVPVLLPPAAASQPYGALAPNVDYSEEMRRMLHVPFGEPAVFGDPAAQDITGSRPDQ